MTTNPASSPGIARTSSRTSSISGRDAIASVTRLAKTWRSIASASPAGTAAARAQRMISESSASISRFSSPTALRGLSERKEFEQTSSAQRSVWCAEVATFGRIS